MRRLLLVCCVVCALCALCAPSLAQNVKDDAPIDPVAAADIFRADRADAIVVGTITDLNKVEFGKMITIGTGNIFATTINQVTVSVDEVIKGKPAEKMTFKSVATLSNLKKPLAVDQKYIFLLTRTPIGYLIMNSSEIMETDRLEKIKARVAENPILMDFAADSTLCPFGKAMPFTLTVFNNSDKPIQVAMENVSVNTFAYSTLMKEPIQFRIQLKEEEGKKPEKPGAVAIEAGGKYSSSYTLECTEPLCMSLFTVDSYLQIPVALRFTVYTQPAQKDDVDIKAMYSITTPWKTVMIGFPMPDDGASVQEIVD